MAGELGGRRIRSPSGRATRPTPERVREAWFSALHDLVPGSRVLDLFAGSGALGLEALSRGAERTMFVERDRRAAGVLRQNVEELELADRCEIRIEDVWSFLADLGPGPEGYYDLVLADPPYDGDDASRLLRRWTEAPFARWLCLEHEARRSDELERIRGADWQRAYGDTALSFYRDDESEQGGER